MRKGRVNLAVLGVGLLVVLPLVAVLANGFRYDPKAISSPLIGKPAPGFALTPLGGGDPVTLASFRGKVVVLNFWATWCVPCAAEHPTLLQLARNFEGRVSFLGIVYQDQPEAIASWLAPRGSLYPQLIDEGSRAALGFGVYGVPETFLVNREGTIVDKIAGAVDGAALQAQLQTLVGG